jgi:SAM-dependent methyltransferase
VTAGKGYVPPSYLDAAAELVRAAKRLSHEWMEAGPGASVLDVGCGAGADTIALAERVGPAGRVVGVDHDAGMLAEADDRAEAAGVAGRVEHLRGDALALPFEDSRFDAARSERLFQHLAAPERALAEMARVTRPGGRVVVMDTDWGSRSVDAPDSALERRMALALAELCLANGYSGRRLYGLFRRQGLADVRVEVIPTQVTSYGLWRLLSRMEMVEQEAVRAGMLAEAEVRRLDESLKERDREGTFFAVTNLMLVAGRRV